MQVIRKAALLLIATTALSGPTRVSSRMQTGNPAHRADLPRLENISSIPAYEYGQYDLGDVVLLDNGVAWSVGYDGQHVSRIYHSTDFGSSWSGVSLPGNGFTFKAIAFPDPQHGWAVGGNGLVIRTTTAGRSWEMLKAPTDGELHAVHFFDSMVGYIAGRTRIGNKITDEVTGSIEIFCTKNGGESWRRCYKEDEPSSAFQIATPSDTAALVVLDGNRLIRTRDQGETWDLVELPGRKISSVVASRPRVLCAVGYGGTFELSEDEGATWRHLNISGLAGSRRNWWDIAFNDESMGIACGDAGALAITLDAGRSWQLLSSERINDDLRGIRLQGRRAIILGAKYVYSLTLSETPR